MNPRTLLAGLLIAAGILVLAYQGITYRTRGKTLDLGPLQVTTEKTRTIPISPILGGVALLSGIALLVIGNSSRSGTMIAGKK